MAMEPLNDEQQAHVDKLIGDARVKAREKAKKEGAEQLTRERETAEAATAVARQEMQTLSETRLTALEKVVAGVLEDTVKRLGEAAGSAVEGLPKSMSAGDKLDWLRQNEKLFQSTGDGVGTPSQNARPEVSHTEPGEICKYPIKL